MTTMTMKELFENLEKIDNICDIYVDTDEDKVMEYIDGLVIAIAEGFDYDLAYDRITALDTVGENQDFEIDVFDYFWISIEDELRNRMANGKTVAIPDNIISMEAMKNIQDNEWWGQRTGDERIALNPNLKLEKVLTHNALSLIITFAKLMGAGHILSESVLKVNSGLDEKAYLMATAKLKSHGIITYYNNDTLMMNPHVISMDVDDDSYNQCLLYLVYLKKLGSKFDIENGVLSFNHISEEHCMFACLNMGMPIKRGTHHCDVKYEYEIGLYEKEGKVRIVIHDNFDDYDYSIGQFRNIDADMDMEEIIQDVKNGKNFFMLRYLDMRSKGVLVEFDVDDAKYLGGFTYTVKVRVNGQPKRVGNRVLTVTMKEENSSAMTNSINVGYTIRQWCRLFALDREERLKQYLKQLVVED